VKEEAEKRMREVVVVVGLGTIGLPVAVAFSGVFDVLGVDTSETRLEEIRSGEFVTQDPEPAMEVQLKAALRTGSLSLVLGDLSVVRHARYVVVCIGLDWVDRPIFEPFDRCILKIAQHIRPGTLVSIETSVPPGTMLGRVVPIIEGTNGFQLGKDVFVVHAPERVAPKKLWHNLLNMPRVIGAKTQRALQKGMDFYRQVLRSDLLPTDLTTAEITKLVENAYRDVNIAFANEVAALCYHHGVEPRTVQRLVNTIPEGNGRRAMLASGAGVGGYCLPKDSHLLLWDRGPFRPMNPSVIHAARVLNDRVPHRLAVMVRDSASRIRDRTPVVMILGKTYAPDSRDTRNSSYTPLALELMESVHPELLVFSHDAVLEPDNDLTKDRSDIYVLATAHSAYEKLILPEVWWVLLNRRFYVAKGENIWKEKV